MTSPIQNTGQPPGLHSHHADAEPNETALGPERGLTDTDAHVVHSNPPGHSHHADPHIGGGDEHGANANSPGGNAPGETQTMGPNGNGVGPSGPHGFGHSQHGDNGLGPGNAQGQGNGVGSGLGAGGNPGNGVSNGFGPQGNQGNGLGNGFGNLGGNGFGNNGNGVGNGNGGFGADGIWGGNNGNHNGLGGFVGDTLGGLLGGSSSASGALASLGNVAGIVQNTVGYAHDAVRDPVGSTLYTVNEGVAQRSRSGEPIVDSDPGGSRAPVRSDSPGTTTSTSDRLPGGSETNVFVRAASADPASNLQTRPTATNVNAPAPNAPEPVVREPVALARGPANASETVVTRADNATLASSSAADRTGASTPLLNGTAAPAQNAGELGVIARVATPLTLIAAPPLAGEGETVSEVGRMALFRADAGNGRESVQDIYGRNYVVYAGDGRNVDKPGNDRAIRAIGTPNVDALEQSRVSNHGELSTHELIWKTVVPALVGVGALFGGASAAGLAVASSGSAGPALLAAATAIFGYGALRASLSLRERAQSGEPTNPLQNANARRDWIAAGANSAGVLASLALMIA
jgi:hypothetical protein